MQTLISQFQRAGVYGIDEHTAQQAQASAQALNYQFTRINLSRIRSAQGVQSKIADALDFPDYFGANWDALLDCLCDLSWLKGAGHVLVLSHSHTLQTKDSASFNTLCEVLAEACAFWQTQSQPFCVLIVDAPLPALPTT